MWKVRKVISHFTGEEMRTLRIFVCDPRSKVVKLQSELWSRSLSPPVDEHRWARFSPWVLRQVSAHILEEVLVGVHHSHGQGSRSSVERRSMYSDFTAYHYVAFSSNQLASFPKPLSSSPPISSYLWMIFTLCCVSFIPPPPFCLYSALAWHHLLQNTPQLLHFWSLHRFVHPSHSHQNYLPTHKFGNVTCLFGKLEWIFFPL